MVDSVPPFVMPDSPVVHRARSVGVPTWLAVATLVVAAGLVPLVIAWHWGALGIPRNDDWAFLLAAFRFSESGSVDAQHWASMNLVGQLVLALPTVWVLGERIAPLQIEVLVLGVVGLVAVFDLGRQLVSRAQALFVAVMVAVSPLWAPLGVSFMTDVPCFALIMVCLALGVRAVRPEKLRGGLFATSLAVGFVAVAIRDIAVAAPVAVALVALWGSPRWPQPLRRFSIATFGLFLVAVAALSWWVRRNPSYHAPVWMPDGATIGWALESSRRLLPLLGVLVAPAVFLARPTALARRAWSRDRGATVVVGSLVVVAVLGWFVAGGSPLGPGNYVYENGVLGNIVLEGHRPSLLGFIPLLAVRLAALMSVTTVAVAAVPPAFDLVARVRLRRWHPPASPAFDMCALAVVGFGALIVVRALGTTLWDRYLLPIVPLVGLLVLAEARSLPSVATRNIPRLAGVVALVGLAALGLVYTVNSASFDGTRWKVAGAVAGKVGARSVDGGFEWVNYHAGRPVFFDPDRPRPCVVLRSETERPAASEDDVVERAAVWGPPGAQSWIVARQHHPC